MTPAKALDILIQRGDALRQTLGDHQQELRDQWDLAKEDLYASFRKEQQELPSMLSRSLQITASTIAGWTTNGRVEQAAEDVLHRMRVPLTLRKQDMEFVLAEIFHWKMRNAYTVAAATVGFPDDVLERLKDLSDQYGNCGWQEGEVFPPLRAGVKEVSRMLGYRYDQEQDRFVPIGNSTEPSQP